MLTNDELNAIEARANAATPGPWVSGGPSARHKTILTESEDVNWHDEVCELAGICDAAFISAARQDVPALVAEVRRLRGWLAGISDHSDRALTQAVAGSIPRMTIAILSQAAKRGLAGESLPSVEA